MAWRWCCGKVQTYISDAVNFTSVVHKLVDLLPVQQLRIVGCLIFPAIFVEQVDDIKTLVLMVAAEDLHCKTSAGMQDLVEAVQPPTILDVKPSERVFEVTRFEIALYHALALTKDLSVVVGIWADVVEVFRGLPIGNVEVVCRFANVRTANVFVH